MKYLLSIALALIVLFAKAQTTGQSKLDASIPVPIQKWLNEKAALKGARPKHKGFFTSDSIKIFGYIKGYDKNAGYASGIIYHSNQLTNEDFPTTVRINKDGTFECSLPGVHPIVSSIIINNDRIHFYAEPGITTGVILDGKSAEYLGVLKSVNDQFAAIQLPNPDYDKLENYQKTQKPEDFKQEQLRNWETASRKADSAMKVMQTTERVRKMVKNQVDLMYAVYLLDYEVSRDYYQKQDPQNEVLKLPMPENYCDFLTRINLNDRTLLVSDRFSTFINRFEYSPVFDRMILYRNQKVRNYNALDSAYLSKNKTSNLVYDIAKVRSLLSIFKFSQYKEQRLDGEIAMLSKSIKDHFVLREMDRMYEKYKLGKVAYDLPNTAAAGVFKKIISPLKGKVLIVDFWAEWCSPCRAGIESSLELRKKYKDNPDFDYVFVTDSESTGEAFYEDFTKKNLMTNTHRITADEYLALRELFKFNGIPRYVLVDAEGKIQDDNFASYNLKSEFQKYFPEKFPSSYWK
ncbi:TlpA disulfide reductase family protein [Pedobacter sp. JY14-1]|uniref:TlpA family protein disulfide reductase n=1 Tax=Pedobacter sp. JY14-1 TaxID=3034151 RepID=UPI0023E235D8|nr:TlpA disulfide reductase family protein [Pedobacter sp. JY14-1]